MKNWRARYNILKDNDYEMYTDILFSKKFVRAYYMKDGQRICAAHQHATDDFILVMEYAAETARERATHKAWKHFMKQIDGK